MRKTSQEKYPVLVYISVILFSLLWVILQTSTAQAQDATKPDLSKPWGSVWGKIYWNKGYYGDEKKTLSGSLSKDVQGRWVFNGKWGRTNSNEKGDIKFIFDTPYSFQGKFKNKSGEWDRKSWNGSTTPKANANVKVAEKSCIEGTELLAADVSKFVRRTKAQKALKMRRLPVSQEFKMCIENGKATFTAKEREDEYVDWLDTASFVAQLLGAYTDIFPKAGVSAAAVAAAKGAKLTDAQYLTLISGELDASRISKISKARAFLSKHQKIGRKVAGDNSFREWIRKKIRGNTRAHTLAAEDGLLFYDQIQQELRNSDLMRQSVLCMVAKNTVILRDQKRILLRTIKNMESKLQTSVGCVYGEGFKIPDLNGFRQEINQSMAWHDQFNSNNMFYGGSAGLRDCK